MGSIRFCNILSCWVQPPDAENRMSGGVGGITGAIPLSPPDQKLLGHTGLLSFHEGTIIFAYLEFTQKLRSQEFE